jgi:hypothetical protein
MNNAKSDSARIEGALKRLATLSPRARISMLLAALERKAWNAELAKLKEQAKEDTE